jgi:hypothetical protein
MLTRPFLTEIDSRAAVKGSRDPLGLQSIWTRMGRQIIGNLTTVSTSVTDFKVLLLGYHFGERLSEAGQGQGDLATFFKWEQLAAYARLSVNNDGAFRGVDRVKHRRGEGKPISFGVDADCQLLANQKIYGLWGLYTVAASASGLLMGTPTRLSSAHGDSVRKLYIPWLGHQVPEIEKLLVKPRFSFKLENQDELLKAIARTLKPGNTKPERKILGDTLVRGDGKYPLQPQLADLLRETFDVPEREWTGTTDSLRTLAARAKHAGHNELAASIDRIRRCESLLAPAAVLFDYLLGCHGKGLGEVAKAIRHEWPTLRLDSMDDLTDDLQPQASDASAGARWIRIANCLRTGDHGQAIELLLDQNQAVMKLRGSAPWIVKSANGTVDVKIDVDPGNLVPGSEIAKLWRHPYFIPSLRSVARQLKEPS